MIVRVLSKNHFDEVLPRMKILNENVELQHSDKAFISILNSDTPNASYFNKDYSNVLRLIFDDATEEENENRIKKGLKELQLITTEQCKSLLSFIEQNKHVETFYVHCSAGVSRSGAVGVFINDLFGEESYFEFANSNPIIKPNYYILAILRRIYNGIEL